MKINNITFFLLFLPFVIYSYEDESHYSKTFDEIRFFRVFTPLDYDASNTLKKYPVIYYFNGCGGSYKKSGTYSYADFGLEEPAAIGRPYQEDYAYPNNAEFENVAYNNDVIIISIDGKIEGMPEGCGVYFPSQAGSWDGNYYNFSVYIRELIEVVDERYKTKADAQFRAVSGLSMGGQMALWVAATNPHLFSSASEFCYSPNFYDVGEPAYQTTVDIQELWRNFRGLPIRHTATNRDYIKSYTDQLYATFSGAGFENNYYLADFCKHYAARIDLQYAFHMNYFDYPKQDVSCFSYINLYPEFEVWGYNISSSKIGNGWIYLHDVTKNGLGIYTRERLPWGKSLPGFNISVSTPAIYTPNKEYTISRYSYRNNSFSSESQRADSRGKLKINSSGGAGEEIGIIGDELQATVFVLTDTINENVYLNDQIETSLNFEIINLSAFPQTVDFVVSTENQELIRIIEQPKQVVIPALSKKRIDSFVTCKGKYIGDYKNTGYIKIAAVIDGIKQEREQMIQVVVKEQSIVEGAFAVKIFDGKKENLDLFTYVWGKWDEPLSSGIISEGRGNGNGIPEPGEIFSIWVETASFLEEKDKVTWHPSIPTNNKDNPDIVLDNISQHQFSTGRAVLSAQMRLIRKPTKDHPVRIPIRVEFLQVQYLENDCHRNAADNFSYAFYDLTILEDGSVSLEAATSP